MNIYNIKKNMYEYMYKVVNLGVPEIYWTMARVTDAMALRLSLLAFAVLLLLPVVKLHK